MQYVLLLAADMCVIVGWLMCVASSEEMAICADNVEWEWGCVDIERGEYGMGEHVLWYSTGLLTARTVYIFVVVTFGNSLYVRGSTDRKPRIDHCV